MCLTPHADTCSIAKSMGNKNVINKGTNEVNMTCPGWASKVVRSRVFYASNYIFLLAQRALDERAGVDG